MPADSKNELERWFEANASHPYATQKDLFELHKRTSLEIKTIKRWLDNRRTKSKTNVHIRTNCKYSHFLPAEKIYLNEFYSNKTRNPDSKQIVLLADILQRNEKKIRAWFANKRFQDKTG